MPQKKLFARELTAGEQEELTEAVRHGKDARLARRAQMVLMSRRGLDASQIAPLCSACYSGVRKILNAFNRGGVAALKDKPRGGRPRKADQRYVELLKQAVTRRPAQYGYVFGCWTLERLREHLARKTRVRLSAAHLARLMARHRIVYRRPKHGMTHLRDPQEYDEKKALLAFVKRGPPRRAHPSTCCTWTNVRFTSTRP